MYEREYDADTIETIEGEVVEVTYNLGRRNAARMGVHMMVATGSDTMSVLLGPVWYLEQQEEKIEKGNQLTITGSRITYDDTGIGCSRGET